MKKKTIYFIVLAMLTSTYIFSETSKKSSEKQVSATEKKPCIECYNMHPEITPLDENGLKTSVVEKISSAKTCGKCHNADYINKHNIHFGDKVKADCITCHVCGSEIKKDKAFNSSGNLDKSIVRIIVPGNENCAQCHGIVIGKNTKTSIPSDFKNLSFDLSGKNYTLTERTGEIISGENISDSLLNLKDKKSLSYPFDVHSHRDVYCISCHFTANDPKRTQTKKSDILANSNDPRKIFDLCKYLYMPDHNLMTADCKSCHEPEKFHSFLPYKRRHFEVLACQSCHVPKVYGPALMSVDETVVKIGNEKKVQYRNVDSSSPNLNTAFNEGFEPFLTSYLQNKSKHIAPANFVTYFRWKDADGKSVSPDILKKVFFKDKAYDPEIVTLLDQNGDGKLDDMELTLNNKNKVDAIKARLVSMGIKDPEIVSEIVPYEVKHNIAEKNFALKDCAACHNSESRFSEAITLTSGITPDKPSSQSIVNTSDKSYSLNGEIKAGNNLLYVKKSNEVKGHYIFGYSRVKWLNALGFIIFLMAIAGVVIHGFMRYISAKFFAEHPRTKKIYMYGLYERIWHWTMAVSVVFLILTGLEIHFNGSFNIFGFDTSIDIHNAFALIITVNAFLSLFYYIATGEIAKFFKIGKGFGKETTAQVFYYLYGIFKGSPHPVEKTPERKFNPLQQITYVMLLNVLFPVQIITGIMMWLVSISESFANSIDGLVYIAPIHNFSAWLFITFLVVHLYLITTGLSPLSSLKGMVTGFEEVEESRIDGNVIKEELSKLRIKDVVANFREILNKRKEGRS